LIKKQKNLGGKKDLVNEEDWDDILTKKEQGTHWLQEN
jgi:hypothetical protein